MYSARQRELRERRAHAARDEEYWLGEDAAAFEVEEGLEFEAPTSFGLHLNGRASAA
jgi:hypothetical protein